MLRRFGGTVRTRHCAVRGSTVAGFKVEAGDADPNRLVPKATTEARWNRNCPPLRRGLAAPCADWAVMPGAHEPSQRINGRWSHPFGGPFRDGTFVPLCQVPDEDARVDVQASRKHVTPFLVRCRYARGRRSTRPCGLVSPRRHGIPNPLMRVPIRRSRRGCGSPSRGWPLRRPMPRSPAGGVGRSHYPPVVAITRRPLPPAYACGAHERRSAVP